MSPLPPELVPSPRRPPQPAWLARFGEVDRAAALFLWLTMRRIPNAQIRRALPDPASAPGSTGSVEGDDKQARTLRSAVVGEIELNEGLGEAVDEMLRESGGVLLARDRLWISTLHAGEVFWPRFTRDKRLDLDQAMRVFALGVIHVAGTRPNLFRERGYNPGALAMAAYTMATGRFLRSVGATPPPVDAEEMSLARHNPVTRQLVIAYDDCREWRDTDLQKALRRRAGKPVDLRLEAIARWSEVFARRFVRPAFEDRGSTLKALDAVSRKRRFGPLKKDDAAEALLSLWAPMEQRPERAASVWYLAADGKLRADAESMMDLLGRHSKSRKPDVCETDLSGDQTFDAAVRVLGKTPDPPVGEAIENAEIVALLLANAIDDIDRRDLELALAGEESCRERARLVGRSETAMRKREARLVERLKAKHPDLVPVVQQLVGPRRKKK